MPEDIGAIERDTIPQKTWPMPAQSTHEPQQKIYEVSLLYPCFIHALSMLYLCFIPAPEPK
jgi:hypothetical protein